MKLNREQIQSLVRQIAKTRAEELDCDQMLGLLTAHADKLARGETFETGDDLAVSAHLEGCTECREEFAMIRAIADEGNLEE